MESGKQNKYTNTMKEKLTQKQRMASGYKEKESWRKRTDRGRGQGTGWRRSWEECRETRSQGNPSRSREFLALRVV